MQEVLPEYTYFSFNVNKLLADPKFQALNGKESGHYLILLCQIFSSGGILDNDELIPSRLKMDATEADNFLIKLEKWKMITISEDFITCDIVSQSINRIDMTSAVRAAAAKTRWDKVKKEKAATSFESF